MYSLRIERTFSAAHAIVLRGEREVMHGHDWRVRVVVEGSELDAEGMLCDFHVLERMLDAVLGPLHNGTLNETPPFDDINPTAELVAAHIARCMSDTLPSNVTRVAASVTEAPGCEATCMLEVTR